jgi:hypothetical protein
MSDATLPVRKQLFRVAEDNVAKRFEHRPPRAEDAGLQLFDAGVETRIDHSRGCPNVVWERRFQERTAHDDLLSPTPDVEQGRCPGGPLGQAAAHCSCFGQTGRALGRQFVD